MNTKEIVSNRKARHHFEILESFETGIVLRGTEIKSLRQGGGSLQESYARVEEGELWLFNMSIAPYSFGNIHNHKETRARKLLMHKKEIRKLKSKVQEKGLSLVPLSMYLKNGRAKLALGLGRGKKLADKRESIKKRDQERSMRQATKGKTQR